MAVAGNRGGAGGARNIARARRKPSPTAIARQQAVQYASQGRAVEKQARVQKLARALPQGPVVRRRPSAVQRARAQEQTYQSQGRAVEREAYRQKPVKVRRREVAAAVPEAVKVHAEREAAHAWADIGENLIASGREPKTAAERRAVKLAVDRQVRSDLRAPRKVRRKLTPLGAGESATGLLGKAITGAGDVAGAGLEQAVTGDWWLKHIGLKAPEGGPAEAVRKTTRNILPDVAELTVTTPSSIAKLATTAATEPKKLPGMLVEPYKELAADPIKFATERPVTTALMLAPGVRMPGRAAGRVARLTGKQTLRREPATVAGTPLRVARTGPRGVVSGAVSARRARGAEAPELTGGRAAREIDKRVDEFYGSVEQPHIRAVRQAAERQSIERGHTPKKAEMHMKGSMSRARRDLNARFADGFGDHAEAKARLAKHRSVGSSRATPARVLRISRRLFTGSVLPYSSKWAAGQLTEAALRSLVSGTGPLSYARARKLMREHPELADELKARAIPGGFGAETLARGGAPTKTLAEEFKGAGGRVERTAKRLTAAGEAPVIGPAIKAAQAGNRQWRTFVFEKAAGRIERGTQTAMLGRALKDSGLMDRSVLGLSDKAIAEAAEGLENTENQVALARQVRRMYGAVQPLRPRDAQRGLVLDAVLAMDAEHRALPAAHPAGRASDARRAARRPRRRRPSSGARPTGCRGAARDHLPGYLMGGYPIGKEGPGVKHRSLPALRARRGRRGPDRRDA